MAPNDTPDTMVREAAALRRAGRVPEAIAAYQRLLAHWPALSDSWYNLALLQRQAGQFDAALASYQQALDRGVAQPEEVHLNRAVIYADHLRQDDAAERELNAALAINPKYVSALLNLANLHEDRGERDAALATYEKILAIDPGYLEALARYASLKGASSPADPLIGRLRTAMINANASDKASLGFALGKILDACGAYDQAFQAYIDANRYSRESANGRALYHQATQERAVDQMIQTFSTQGQAAPAASNPPIFICGMFRSGSTLVEQVLASHPRVMAGGELDLLPAFARELAPFPASMRDIAAEKLTALAARYRDNIAKRFPGANIVTDKRPDNFLYIGLIKRLFPNAKIINTTRDALDNCLSVFFLHLDHGMPYALDLMDTAHYYKQYRRLMAHWKSLYGDDILDFDYDAFVRDPKPGIEKLLAFCGLDWNDACLEFHRARGAVKTASVWQVREPLYQRSSGRWRNYEAHLGPLRAYLGGA